MRQSYQTNQRKYILEYLKENSKCHTIEEIFDALKKQKHFVGKTTIYRYLEYLHAKGMVQKFITDSKEKTQYQYDTNANQHYHLKCIQCGKIIHFHCQDITHLHTHIYQIHHFSVDMNKTIIYGHCQQCKKEKQNEKIN